MNVSESNLGILFSDQLVLGVRAALRDTFGDFHLFGMCVSDVLSGRPPGNLLVLCPGDSGQAARAIARACGLSIIRLAGSEGVYHLPGTQGDRRSVTVLTRAGAPGEHLALCPFTVLAIAASVSGERPVLFDPQGGLPDLSRGRLRVTATRAGKGDVGDSLTSAVLSDLYDLEPDDDTWRTLEGWSSRTDRVEPASAWRSMSLLFGGRGLSRKARFLRRCGALGSLLPEVAGLFDVPQNYYHHLGVWEHTLEVLDVLEDFLCAPSSEFRAYSGRISRHLEVDVEGGVSRRSYLGVAALIHDIGKSEVMEVDGSGRIRFQEHQTAGAAMAASIAARMSLGLRGRQQLVGLVGQHMRLGSLLKEGETAAARLRAARELGGRTVEIVMLSLADRVATRGPAATPEAMEVFRRTAKRVLADYFWDSDNPELVSGCDVLINTGVEPGPRISEQLFDVRVAQREGTVENRMQALEYLAPDFKGRIGLG